MYQLVWGEILFSEANSVTTLLYFQELKHVQVEETGNEKDDDEMDVSDDDEQQPKKKSKSDVSSEEINKLREENDSLKCQMEAYKNEVCQFF